MADGTKIEWTDATWNPITGCAIVSKGCTNCYAMRLAGTRLQHHPSRAGLTKITKPGPVWTGETRFNEQWLDQPLRWRRPRKIFVCAHGDLFAETVKDGWIDQVFAVMALASHHQYQVLTKRPARMRAYLTDPDALWRIGHLLDQLAPSSLWNGSIVEASRILADRRPLPNVWLGTSVEDQSTADERVPELLEAPAAIRFISAEPLLGTVVFAGGWLGLGDNGRFGGGRLGGINQIIVGGESGRGARPMHPDWVRSIRDQCQAAGAAFFFKQWGAWRPDEGPPPQGADRIMDGVARCAWWDGQRWHYEQSGYQADLYQSRGEWVYRLGKAAAGRLLDGREWSEFPA